MPQSRSRTHSERPLDETPAHARNGHATTHTSIDDEPLTAAASTAYIAPRFTSTGSCSLTSITSQAASLGVVFATSAIFTLQLASAGSRIWRLPFFLSICAVFHFMEFWATARWNPGMADRNSFLIVGNGIAQPTAYAVALVEFVVREWFLSGHYGLWTREASMPFISANAALAVGVMLVVTGQTARSMAMMEAGTSFNHLVQYSKKDDHVLITSGIYSLIRHPSYFGFFYWALGTQLALANTFSFCAYAFVLWKFFSHRIRHEEKYLISFFGDDYRSFRAKTPTWIPFVGS